MRFLLRLLVWSFPFGGAFVWLAALAGTPAANLDHVCPRPPAGSVIEDPPQTASRQGVLATTLVARNAGSGPEDPVNNYDYRFCLLEEGDTSREAPALRLKPGDHVRLKLLNRMSAQAGFPRVHLHTTRHVCPKAQSLVDTSVATLNLHYHGLNIPPGCHADDVITTVIQPANGNPENLSEFNYRFHIPANEPPGLYWYHPHIHGVAQQQLLGGMTGPLIIEGMDRLFPELKGMRERILVLRDLDKPDPGDNPDAPSDEPWKNVSLNGVPIVYGNPATPRLSMGAGERQFWRVANASADMHFVLQVQFNAKGASDGWEPQTLELIARDGMPFVADHGHAQGRKLNVQQIVLPPAARAEFIVTGPPVGVAARFYSADYNQYLSAQSAGCAPGFPGSVCDNTDRNPAWTLARITPDPAASQQSTPLATPLSEPTAQVQRFVGLAAEKARKERTLFFSKDPREDGEFFITVAGNLPQPFDMAGPPDITVHGPTVEDWTIENRDNESHDFHIHQIHFRLMEVNGVSTDESKEHVLRDTIQIGACRKWAEGIDPENDPYGLNFPPGSPRSDPNFTGKNCITPATVKLRMDFRDRNIVGTFVYHCHILEHEDGGMMRKIRLE